MGVGACHVSIPGALAKNPEMKYTEKGTAVTKLSIPVETGWGENKKTTWFNVTAFGNLAERCAEHLRKGSLVCVGGELDAPYVNSNGVASQNVRANTVAFLSNFGKNASNGGDKNNGGGKSGGSYDGDEIPF